MIRFILAGEQVNEPSNFRELSLGFDFGSAGRSTPFVDLPALNWVNQEADLINQWVKDGLASGYGLLEGVPLSIDYIFPESTSFERVFSGYIPLFDQSVTLDCDSITAPAVSDTDPEAFRNLADSFSFAYLRKQEIITPEDYIDVYYVLNKVPDAEGAAIVSVTIFLLGKEVFYIIDQMAGVAMAMIANVITIPAGIIRIIFLILYLILTIIAIVKLINQLKDLLFPQPKTYRGMLMKTLLEKGCQALGLKFSSTIFNQQMESRLAILPQKYGMGVRAGLEGFDSGYPEMTFGQLLATVSQMFNADYRIENGTLYFERRDKLGQYSGFTLKELPRNSSYKTNASELSANHIIRLQTDGTDSNTIQNTQGTRYQVTVSAKTQLDQKHTGLQGLREINIPFARATRKNAETNFEKFYLKALYNGSISLNSLIRKVSNGKLGKKFRQNRNKSRYRDKIKQYDVSEFTDRDPTQVEFSEVFDQLPEKLPTFVGLMMVHQDYFTQDKLCIIDPARSGYLHEDNDRLNAQYFWDNYHYIESAVPSDDRPKGNQYIKYEGVRIPLCGSDFIRLSKYNVIYIESLASRAEITRLTYNPFTQEAVLNFRINQLYTQNVKEIKTDGSANTTVEQPTQQVDTQEISLLKKVAGDWVYDPLPNAPAATLISLSATVNIYTANGELIVGQNVYKDMFTRTLTASGTYFNKMNRKFIEVNFQGIITKTGTK